MSAELVPMHPEPVDGDDREVRWVVPAGTFPGPAAVAGLPDSLRVLVDDGTLESVTVEPSAVRTRLTPGRRWRDDGARVRTALRGALAEPRQWRLEKASRADDALREAVRDVIGGEVGAYIRAHGGNIRLVDVRDGTVEVRLTGACQHCPASAVTLTDRFEKAVRLHYPAVRSVNAAGVGGRSGTRRAG